MGTAGETVVGSALLSASWRIPAMKKTVWTFGLISGVVISALMLLTIPFHDELGLDHSLVVGYTTMVLAFLLIWFGIRSYRDNVGGGAVRFGRAFAVGILIVCVSNVLYVATWELVYPRYMPDFYEKYEAAAIARAQANGPKPEAVAEIHKQVEMYRNPVMNALFTFIEPLPVGLLVTLISAWILSRRRSAVAMQT